MIAITEILYEQVLDTCIIYLIFSTPVSIVGRSQKYLLFSFIRKYWFDMKLESIKVSLKLPQIADIEGTWKFDEQEKKAAWEMYVELITRISIWELRPDEGLLREALSSLYSIFGTTRTILRQYGPGIAQPKGEGKLSFGYLAITILNVLLRPLLDKWHPMLLDYEKRCPADISQFDHEKNWEKAEELRNELNRVRLSLMEYANLLSQAAGVDWNFSPKQK